jgi:hypothetical protein
MREIVGEHFAAPGLSLHPRPRPHIPPKSQIALEAGTALTRLPVVLSGWSDAAPGRRGLRRAPAQRAHWRRCKGNRLVDYRCVASNTFD